MLPAVGHGPEPLPMSATAASPLPDLGSLTYSRRMKLDDSALMLQFKDGDARAFEELYRRHNDALYRYFLRLGGDAAAAEDLYQEAWSKIIRARSGYQPSAKFTTYLYHVARNCFIDYVRRNRRHRSGVDVDPDSQPGHEESPEAQTETSLARRRLEAALDQLPEEQRDVFLLHEEAGLGLDDIAFVTDSNREATKSRLRYAVKKLKAALNDCQDTP